ncbi:MAG: undecaprenyl diphosphate synthase family protein, partial [Alphaproteobacteria bacterium]
DGLPAEVLDEMDRTVEMTRNNTGMTLALAVNYGGRTEIAKATRRIADKVARGELRPEEIDESIFDQHLDTAGMPDPARTAHPAPRDEQRGRRPDHRGGDRRDGRGGRHNGRRAA